MTTKVQFHANTNSVGRVTDESFKGNNAVLFMGGNTSPILDSDVKILYFPDELGGGFSPVIARYLSASCPVCNGHCPTAVTDRMNNQKQVSVLHCSKEVKFFFINGIPHPKEEE